MDSEPPKTYVRYSSYNRDDDDDVVVVAAPA